MSELCITFLPNEILYRVVLYLDTSSKICFNNALCNSKKFKIDLNIIDVDKLSYDLGKYDPKYFKLFSNISSVYNYNLAMSIQNHSNIDLLKWMIKKKHYLNMPVPILVCIISFNDLRLLKNYYNTLDRISQIMIIPEMKDLQKRKICINISSKNVHASIIKYLVKKKLKLSYV